MKHCSSTAVFPRQDAPPIQEEPVGQADEVTFCPTEHFASQVLAVGTIPILMDKLPGKVFHIDETIYAQPARLLDHPVITRSNELAVPG